MSQSITDRAISRQRLMQMLNRRNSEASDAAVGASDAPLFDWTCPHHFDSQGWPLMHNLGKRIALSIETVLGPMCLEPPKVTLKKVVQDFAYILANRAESQEKPQYFMPFSVQNKRPEGFLGIQSEAAGVLIAQMLRDPESSLGQNGFLSSLEESILQDAATGLVDVVITELQESGQITLKRADQIVRGDWPLEVKQLQDLCGFAFTVAFPKKSIEITVMAVGEIMDLAMGIAVRTQKPLTPAELSKKISRQLHDVPVEVTARLCMSSIRIEDLVTLEPGDVLVIDKKTTEPIETLLNGRLCFHAWPAVCEGKLSLVVSQFKK
jgi:flagellar motor switch/type III secretory pathway protein FliN